MIELFRKCIHPSDFPATITRSLATNDDMRIFVIFVLYCSGTHVEVAKLSAVLKVITIYQYIAKTGEMKEE